MIRTCAVIAFIALSATAASADLPAAALKVGTVEYVRGDVTASREGTVRKLETGAPVHERERVATGRNGVLVLQMEDQTRFTLARSAQMEIDAFRHRPDNPEADGLSARILRGTFRFVSGLVAKRRPAAMTVELSVATIGIRGTDVAGEVKEDSAVVVLQDGEGGAPGAITVSNAHGSVDINQAGYGTTIPTASSPPTPPQRMRLRSIENLQRSLQAARRAARPRP